MTTAAFFLLSPEASGGLGCRCKDGVVSGLQRNLGGGRYGGGGLGAGRARRRTPASACHGEYAEAAGSLTLNEARLEWWRWRHIHGGSRRRRWWRALREGEQLQWRRSAAANPITPATGDEGWRAAQG